MTIIALAPFILVLVIVGLPFFFAFYRQRLEHKQIMAAIEKGIPLSELRPVKPAGSVWIKNITAGIALLIIALPLLLFGFFALDRWLFANLQGQPWNTFLSPLPLLLGIILFAIGISKLIRGLLLRKTDKAQTDMQPSSRTKG